LKPSAVIISSSSKFVAVVLAAKAVETGLLYFEVAHDVVALVLAAKAVETITCENFS